MSPEKERFSCRLCRLRKIKCDRTKPACTRCTTYGKPCPGYARPSRFEFVVYQPMTASFEGRNRHSADEEVAFSPVSNYDATGPPIPDSHLLGNGDIKESEISDYHSDDEEGLAILGCKQSMRSLHNGSHRLQMLSNFLDFQLKGDKLVAFHNLSLLALPTIDLSAPALQAALDTLCFVGLGFAANDQVLLESARLRYGHALYLLNRELSYGARKDRFRPVVTSIMLLRLCALFKPLDLDPGPTEVGGWCLHLEAAQQYLEACGPDDLLESDYDWKLFQNVRFSSTYLDIVKRRPCMFERDEWQRITLERAKEYAGVALYSLRARVPGLLAREDALICHPDLNSLERKLARLFTDQHRLRQDLGDWMISWHDTASISTVTFDSVKEDEPMPFASEAFQTHYKFDCAGTASLWTTSWMLCLALDCSIIRLLQHYQFSLATLLAPFSLASVQHDAYTNATKLCQSFWYTSHPAIAASPNVGSWHLKFAGAFFNKAGLIKEAEWCRAARDEILRKRNDDDAGGGKTMLMSALSQQSAADRSLERCVG